MRRTERTSLPAASGSHSAATQQLNQRPIAASASGNQTNRTRSDSHYQQQQQQQQLLHHEDSDDEDADNAVIDDDIAISLPANSQFDANNPKIALFIRKLYIILEDKRNEPYIKWRDDGLSFIVVDTAGFAEKVIPLHFRHSKYPSFVRQLNLHGFRKMQSVFQGSLKPVKGPYVDEIYSNPDFQRDDPSLMVRIKRNKQAKPQQQQLLQSSQAQLDGSMSPQRANQSNAMVVRDQALVATTAAPSVAGAGNTVSTSMMYNQAVAIDDKSAVRVIYDRLNHLGDDLAKVKEEVNSAKQENKELVNQISVMQNQINKHELNMNAMISFIKQMYSSTFIGRMPPNMSPNNHERRIALAHSPRGHNGTSSQNGTGVNLPVINADTDSIPQKRRLITRQGSNFDFITSGGNNASSVGNGIRINPGLVAGGDIWSSYPDIGSSGTVVPSGISEENDDYENTPDSLIDEDIEMHDGEALQVDSTAISPTTTRSNMTVASKVSGTGSVNSSKNKGKGKAKANRTSIDSQQSLVGPISPVINHAMMYQPNMDKIESNIHHIEGELGDISRLLPPINSINPAATDATAATAPFITTAPQQQHQQQLQQQPHDYIDWEAMLHNISNSQPATTATTTANVDYDPLITLPDNLTIENLNLGTPAPAGLSLDTFFPDVSDSNNMFSSLELEKILGDLSNSNSKQ